MNEWVIQKEREPKVNQYVWYFFEFTGVNYGRYHGDDCFGGTRGFLTGDVTHWMEAPLPPYVSKG